nr:hypothetical protein [Tanacetum cinerariifolium]
MRTRSQSHNNFPQQEASPTIVEPLHIELPFLEDQFQEDPPEEPPQVPMADNQTMAELLQAPTKGYEDAIVVSAITADNFELKHATMADQRTMAQLLQAPTEGYEDAVVVPVTTADNFELKHGILTLVQNKQSFGHDKDDPHAHIRYFNKITSTLKFPNVPITSIKLMLFSFSLEELHQLDTFYNALNSKDQDSWNSAARGQNQSPAPVKAVEESCVTCGDAHSYRNCPATDDNNYCDNIQEFVSQSSTVNYNQGNTSYHPPMMSNQIRPPGFPPAPAYQVSAPQTQGILKEDFLAYVKANDAVMKNTQTQVQFESPVSIFEPAIAPVSASKPNPKASIPYQSRRNDERNREKANNQIEKFYQIFRDMSFEISFADALILMPKFASTLKALIGNKEKLSMAECLALADLGASINLMPFSVWKRLSLPDLTPTYFDADLQVPLILRRSILKTERALIDVFESELTLRVGKEAITFNLDQTSRYLANYSDMMAKRIDVIDMACEEYSQEVLGFSNTISSGNPTPYYDPIIFATSPTLTPFENNDFLLEEGDMLLLEAFLNDDPSLPPLNQRNYLPKVCKEHKICEAKSDKSLVDEPLVVELKVLPPHLKYAFLEGDDKLPVIIVKDLSVEEKTALLTVLKSHKRAIAWKLSDIKGINPEFCTYKIIIEEDFEPTVQHQRRVNPKIHDVIKQESCLSHFEKMLKRCEDTNLCLNWEKSHFMVKEGIVLGHKSSKQGIEVDKAKVDVISKIPHPTTIKGIRSFLGHAGFYRRFIQDFSKIARPMTRLLEKDTPFIFSQECIDAFQTLKRKLTEAPILIALDWDMTFELMCDASDFAIGVVLGQRQDKHLRPIHYASKTMTEAESNYTTTKKEILAVVYAFEKFRSYLILNKSIVYTDHSALIICMQRKIQRRYCSDGFYFSKNSPSKRKPLKSSRLATLDQHEVTMDEITQPESNPISPANKWPSGSVNRGLKRIMEKAVGFPAQSVGSSNTKVLDSPCLLVLIIETSQSRQH